MEGWRAVFVSVAAVSAGIGVLNLTFAQDPNFGADGQRRDKDLEPITRAEALRQMWAVLTIPTFLIIIMQVCLQWRMHCSHVLPEMRSVWHMIPSYDVVDDPPKMLSIQGNAD